MLLFFDPLATRAAANWIRVGSEPVTNRFHAYGQVEPVAVIPIRSALAGAIKGLSAVVGQPVHGGEKLAGLGGPEVAALLAQQQAAVESAKTNVAGSEQVLDIARQQIAFHLSTRQSVAQAESELAKAQGNLLSAEGERGSPVGARAAARFAAVIGVIRQCEHDLVIPGDSKPC